MFCFLKMWFYSLLVLFGVLSISFKNIVDLYSIWCVLVVFLLSFPFVLLVRCSGGLICAV